MQTENSAPLGLILAGGRGRRMGGADKALLPLAGRPLLAHVVDALAPQTAGIVLNANAGAERFAHFRLTVIADPAAGFPGPLAGILAGMMAARAAGLDHVLTVAVDTPFFPPTLAERLAAARPGPEAIAIAASGGRTHPVFGLWPAHLADDLADWLGRSEDRSVRAWVSRHPAAVADFVVEAAGCDPFFNINTPADLVAAEARLAALQDADRLARRTDNA